jgi:hypothetical protein
LLDIGKVGCESYDVIHGAAYRSECCFDVRKGLRGLGAKSLGGLSAGIDAGLASDKNKTMRAVDLHHLAVSCRLGHPRRIGMPHICGGLRCLCRSWCNCGTGRSRRRYCGNELTARRRLLTRGNRVVFTGHGSTPLMRVVHVQAALSSAAIYRAIASAIIALPRCVCKYEPAKCKT